MLCVQISLYHSVQSMGANSTTSYPPLNLTACAVAQIYNLMVGTRCTISSVHELCRALDNCDAIVWVGCASTSMLACGVGGTAVSHLVCVLDKNPEMTEIPISTTFHSLLISISIFFVCL